ncbi:hypothetical protein IB267_32955 [Ensifer sp. ENS09]|uniref:thioesterase domain-containing protein n=1 Tax=Ensifer sp. ENS09 TaxID=2769263 RepID=UPI001783ED20|nr:thioesterase domain-containing protein [Ensifer sp. ENS09]MBD9653170.1 hypothetical protein [Ensifer sp. ENS09]
MKRPEDLIVLLDGGEKPPLFCVHSVSGFATFYRLMTKPLENLVYGINAIDVTLSELPLRTVEDMAERYVGELLEIEPHGPYYLCGFSMGGLLAYEMAVQLIALGKPVEFLGLIDTFIASDPIHLHTTGLERQNWLTFLNIVFGGVDESYYDEHHVFWDMTNSQRISFIAERENWKNRAAPTYINNAWVGRFHKIFIELLVTSTKYRVPKANVNLHYFSTGGKEADEAIEILKGRAIGGVKTMQVNGTHFDLFNSINAEFLGQTIAHAINTVKKRSRSECS